MTTTLLFALLTLVQGEAKPLAVAPSSTLKFMGAYELPKVEGRIDHMAFWDFVDFSEVYGQLFIAARDNGTIEHVDVKNGVVRDPLLGPRKPQGIALVSLFSLFVADGETGDLWAFEVPQSPGSPTPTETPRRLDLGSDADNIRHLPRTARLLVGYGDGAIAVMQYPNLPNAGRPDADREMEVETRIELGAHPESFQFDRLEERCWVNVPDKAAIAVVDLKSKKVARWIEVKSAKKNYPMALAEKAKRLLVGCREPAKLLVIDIDTDAVTAELPLSGDVDDIFVDEERELIYASCGEGFVDVFSRTDAGAWRPKERVATAPGARTCLFVASEKKLFVAVPHRGEQKAEVRVFSTAP